MRKSKATKAFEDIAVREGKSVAEVRSEIQNAIDEAMKSTDPVAQEYWKRLSKNGKKPTPEDVVVDIAKRVKSKKYLT